MSNNIKINDFEIIFSDSVDVLICCISRAIVPNHANIKFEGNTLIIERGDNPALAFEGITPADKTKIINAKNIILNRTVGDLNLQVVLKPIQ